MRRSDTEVFQFIHSGTLDDGIVPFFLSLASGDGVIYPLWSHDIRLVSHVGMDVLVRLGAAQPLRCEDMSGSSCRVPVRDYISFHTYFNCGKITHITLPPARVTIRFISMSVVPVR